MPHYVSSHGDRVIHFTYQEGNVYYVACMPGVTELHKTKAHPTFMRSNDPRAVSCPACKKTRIFAELSKNVKA